MTAAESAFRIQGRCGFYDIIFCNVDWQLAFPEVDLS